VRKIKDLILEQFPSRERLSYGDFIHDEIGVRQIPCGEGVLIVTSEELSSPGNPQHIAQAQALRAALQGRY
jgi:hypothetical protein